jgi:hypothetical protein
LVRKPTEIEVREVETWYDIKSGSVSPTSSATKKAKDKTMAMINLVEVDELLRAML